MSVRIETRTYSICPHCGISLGLIGGNDGLLFIGRPYRTCSRCGKSSLPSSSSALENQEWEMKPTLYSIYYDELERDLQKMEGAGSFWDSASVGTFFGLLLAVPVCFISYVACFDTLKSRPIGPIGLADAYLFPILIGIATLVLTAIAATMISQAQAANRSEQPEVAQKIAKVLQAIDESRTRMADPGYRQQLRALGLNVRSQREQQEPAYVAESVEQLQLLKRQAEAKYASLHPQQQQQQQMQADVAAA